MIIKGFLILSVLVVMAYVARGRVTGRQLAIRRLAGVAFSLTWIVAVISPDLVTQAANLVGVGRGTDLVLYVLAVAFLVTAISQRQHLLDVDGQIGQLTRELALLEAARPQQQPQGSSDESDD